jgi:tetrahydromethanopterin S-methyltransferase subunit G
MNMQNHDIDPLQEEIDNLEKVLDRNVAEYLQQQNNKKE